MIHAFEIICRLSAQTRRECPGYSRVVWSVWDAIVLAIWHLDVYGAGQVVV